jgi:hypothetical protein
METDKNFARTIKNKAIRRVSSNSRRRRLNMAIPGISSVTLNGENTSHRKWF